jgi:hypothetical protein
MRVNQMVFAGVIALAGIVLWSSAATAARISDVTNTKHNFSKSSSETVRASNVGSSDSPESEICIFCHTPHGADTSEGPLWNKDLPNPGEYTEYTSSSIDSNIGQVNGASKLCLSCHDGTIAIGSLRNVRGQQGTIDMQGTGGNGAGSDRMPGGEGTTTGYTRNLGQDLSNDHPISLTYNSSFVNSDGEMRDPGDDPLRVRGRTPRPGIQDIHLQPVNKGDSVGQVQCISCHDPHIRETSSGEGNIKFLRLNRLQKANPTGSNTFSTANDIICLACHTKAGWATSAHAQRNIADEAYTSAAASTREFPSGTEVWESACLACHDTHTVQGSRRLLRGGTDGGASGSIKSGGNSAIEETCYACHANNGGGTLSGAGDVPDIKTDFSLNTHMPITTDDQTGSPNNDEAHDITDANLMESANNLNNVRHVECTDCHNPHRVVKRQMFNEHNGNGSDAEGTHIHENNTEHTNIASGVLRGTWGVEPNYGSNESFHVAPGSFTVKRGEPNSTSTGVNNSYLTREYQVCLKCHSNYAFGNSPPSLGGSGLTPWRTNGMEDYTNVAREYNSPDNHQGEGQDRGQEGGADSAYDSNNHRAWHPVVNSTGRNSNTRANTPSSNWIDPFQNLGSQTMYCSDCHGSTTPSGTVVPNGGTNGSPWGPHGSDDNFILKGPWSGSRGGGTGVGQQGDLCFKCHVYNEYAGNGTANSGFSTTDGCMAMCAMGGGGGGGGGGMDGGGDGGGGGGMGGQMNNLHTFHAAQVQNFRCNLCHVAVPHGWKNKNFLVNLNDVGPEAGLSRGTERRFSTDGYTASPYYNRAALKIVNFRVSGDWMPNACGSASGDVGVDWMVGGSQACVNVP